MSGIEEYSVANALGITQVLFCCICYHNCSGCHNPESHHYINGYDMTIYELYNRVKSNRNKNVTFSGGDPMFQANQFLELAKLIKSNTQKTIWCYTGFTYDEIINSNDEDRKELLKYIDVLVDGKFVEKEKDLTLKFRGSKNQRIIKVQESLKQDSIVFYQI